MKNVRFILCMSVAMSFYTTGFAWGDRENTEESVNQRLLFNLGGKVASPSNEKMAFLNRRQKQLLATITNKKQELKENNDRLKESEPTLPSEERTELTNNGKKLLDLINRFEEELGKNETVLASISAKIGEELGTTPSMGVVKIAGHIGNKVLDRTVDNVSSRIVDRLDEGFGDVIGFFISNLKIRDISNNSSDNIQVTRSYLPRWKQIEMKDMLRYQKHQNQQ